MTRERWARATYRHRLAAEHALDLVAAGTVSIGKMVLAVAMAGERSIPVLIIEIARMSNDANRQVRAAINDYFNVADGYTGRLKPAEVVAMLPPPGS